MHLFPKEEGRLTHLFPKEEGRLTHLLLKGGEGGSRTFFSKVERKAITRPRQDQGGP